MSALKAWSTALSHREWWMGQVEYEEFTVAILARIKTSVGSTAYCFAPEYISVASINVLNDDAVSVNV